MIQSASRELIAVTHTLYANQPALMVDGNYLLAALLAFAAGEADCSSCILKQTALWQIMFGTSNQQRNKA